MKNVISAVLLLVLLSGRASAEVVDYVGEVLPLMKKHCWNCHSNEKEVKGNLALEPETLSDQIGKYNIIRPGDPDASGFVERLKLDPGHTDFMPRKADPLSKRDVEKIEAWIRGGAIVDAKKPTEEEAKILAERRASSPKPGEGAYLTWRNREGKALEARMHSLSGGSVKLILKDGKSYDVPLSSLDEESANQAKRLAAQ
jgi:mono/diheme cytochrome c family protein